MASSCREQFAFRLQIFEDGFDHEVALCRATKGPSWPRRAREDCIAFLGAQLATLDRLGQERLVSAARAASSVPGKRRRKWLESRRVRRQARCPLPWCRRLHKRATFLIVPPNSFLRSRRYAARTPLRHNGTGQFRTLPEPIRDRGRERALRPFANEDADMAARKGDLGVVLRSQSSSSAPLSRPAAAITSCSP